MRKLLNTLYVTTQGAYLAKEGETLHVRADRETKLRLPVHNLEGVVCFGNVLCSPFLLGHCAEKGVAISFLTENGRFLARVTGRTAGNVLLRREQYRRADSAPETAGIAAAIVTAKLANCRAVLQRGTRDRPEDEGNAALTAAADSLRGSIRRLKPLLDSPNQPKPNEASHEPAPRKAPVDSVRGIEGDGARTYFGAFDALITSPHEAFRFNGRNRRPPTDPVNALLSFLYTLLLHDIQGALESVGLDPAVGFLHRDRPGRPGLALDLMEELRPVVADRLALSLINRGQLKPSGFRTEPAGGVWLKDDDRKTVLKAYQERKRDEIRHPFLDEKIAFGLVPHAQALLFARYMRGDLDAYPPFVWK